MRPALRRTPAPLTCEHSAARALTSAASPRSCLASCALGALHVQRVCDAPGRGRPAVHSARCRAWRDPAARRGEARAVPAARARCPAMTRQPCVRRRWSLSRRRRRASAAGARVRAPAWRPAARPAAARGQHAGRALTESRQPRLRQALCGVSFRLDPHWSHCITLQMTPSYSSLMELQAESGGCSAWAR